MSSMRGSASGILKNGHQNPPDVAILYLKRRRKGGWGELVEVFSCMGSCPRQDIAITGYVI